MPKTPPSSEQWLLYPWLWAVSDVSSYFLLPEFRFVSWALFSSVIAVVALLTKRLFIPNKPVSQLHEINQFPTKSYSTQCLAQQMSKLLWTGNEVHHQLETKPNAIELIRLQKLKMCFTFAVSSNVPQLEFKAWKKFSSISVLLWL